MPVVAASLTDAMALTTDRIALENRTAGQVFSQYVIFIDLVQDIFNPENRDERTVRNWMVQAKLTQAALFNFGASFAAIGVILRQDVVDIVERILNATHVNTAQIPVAQRTAVLAAWNASFGALP